jgi:multiple sugar transport system permease protein
VVALTAYLFMAPSLIVLAIFFFGPMLSALRMSLQDYSMFGPSEWNGGQNYLRLLRDSAFRNALSNTIYYALVSTPVSIALALVLALALNARIPARAFFRASLFLPSVTSLAIVAIGWSFLLNPDIGLLNYWLGRLGLASGRWLTDPNLAMPSVILVGIWRNTGFYMVIYLAGLQSIPSQFYEAAAIDGVNGWQRFARITWPLLSNTTMFVFVTAGIAALQAFDQIYVMTRGGPFFQTETLVMMIYRLGFQEFRMGYAAAVSYVLLILAFILSLLLLAWFRPRQVTY